MVVWSCGFGPEAAQFMRMVACIEGGCSPQGYQEVRRRKLLFQYPLQGHSANDLLPPARPRLLQVPNASQKYHRLVTKSLVYMGLKRTLHVLLAVVTFSYFPEWAIIFFPVRRAKISKNTDTWSWLDCGERDVCGEGRRAGSLCSGGQSDRLFQSFKTKPGNSIAQDLS